MTHTLPRTGHLWLFRVLMVLYALFWLNVTLSASSASEAHSLQEFAYRTLYAVGLVVVPAMIQLRRPERNIAAQQQLILTATAHMVGTFVALYFDPLAYALVAIAVVLGVLHPQRSRVFALAARADRWTVGAVIVIALPLAAFVVGQAWLLARDGTAEWEDTMVFAVALLLTFALAATRTVGWRVPAYTAAVVLAAYGVTSALGPRQASSWGSGWGRAAVIGAVIWIVVMEAIVRTTGLRPEGDALHELV